MCNVCIYLVYIHLYTCMYMDVVVNTAPFVSFTEVDSIVHGSGVELVCVPEIMEEIFGWLPISQLYSSCRLVCRRWNNIICRQKVYSPPRIHILYLLFSPRCTCSGGLRYLYMWICMETFRVFLYTNYCNMKCKV